MIRSSDFTKAAAGNLLFEKIEAHPNTAYLNVGFEFYKSLEHCGLEHKKKALFARLMRLFFSCG